MKSDSLDGEVHLKMLKLSLHLGGYDRPGVDGWGGGGEERRSCFAVGLCNFPFRDLSDEL